MGVGERKVDRFQALQIFRMVVEQGGFTAAARKLNISPSAATKNITSLEVHLGVQLLNRSTRSIALTDHGRSFYEAAVAILTRLDEAENGLRDANSAARGLVRIVMPPSFGRVTFTPELPAFLDENPGITLDVHFADTPVDMIKEGFDLAVRSREQEDSQLIQRILHRGPMVTVASPAYLAQHGAPQSPGDLAGHRCITGVFGSEWRFRTPDGGEERVQIDSAVILRSGDNVREGAVAGVGIAQSTWWLFRKDLAEGRLVRILEPFEREAVPISVFYPAKRNVPRKVSRVIDFLLRISGERAG
jgi:DNA-binding transcriptional LysR family regulator